MLIVNCLMKNRMNATPSLKEWLQNVRQVADLIIILDNGSTDGTYEYLKEQEKLIVYQDTRDFFEYEQYLHAELWERTRKVARTNDMILLLASDEFIQGNLISHKKEILSNTKIKSCYFHLVHLWDKDGNIRIDKLWGFRPSPRLFRFKNMEFGNLSKGIHKPALPQIAIKQQGANVLNSCIIHYGFFTKKLRENKFNAYLNNSSGDNKLSVESLRDTYIQTINLKELETYMSNYGFFIKLNQFIEMGELIKRNIKKVEG